MSSYQLTSFQKYYFDRSSDYYDNVEARNKYGRMNDYAGPNPSELEYQLYQEAKSKFEKLEESWKTNPAFTEERVYEFVTSFFGDEDEVKNFPTCDAQNTQNNYIDFIRHDQMTGPIMRGINDCAQRKFFVFCWDGKAQCFFQRYSTSSTWTFAQIHCSGGELIRVDDSHTVARGFFSEYGARDLRNLGNLINTIKKNTLDLSASIGQATGLPARAADVIMEYHIGDCTAILDRDRPIKVQEALADLCIPPVIKIVQEYILG